MYAVKVGMYAVKGGDVCRERWGCMPLWLNIEQITYLGYVSHYQSIRNVHKANFF